MSSPCSRVPDGQAGDWWVSSFQVTAEEARRFNLYQNIHPERGFRHIHPGTYKKLLYKHEVVMSDTPAEMQDHHHFIHMAHGSVLLTGLGLGMVLGELLKKKDVKHIMVLEKSLDVIKLVAGHYQQADLEIINADALTWKIPKGVHYDFIWHDIWNGICADNLESMRKLKRRFARCSPWQGCWCEIECMRIKRQWG